MITLAKKPHGMTFYSYREALEAWRTTQPQNYATDTAIFCLITAAYDFSGFTEDAMQLQAYTIGHLDRYTRLAASSMSIYALRNTIERDYYIANGMHELAQQRIDSLTHP